MKATPKLSSGGVSWVVVALAVFPGAAWSGEPRTHDGFFLRLSTGGGSAYARIESPSASLKLSGFAPDLNMAIGGRVAKNLMLHGTIWGWFVEDPRGELKVPGVLDLTETVHGTLDMTAFGGGLTYYLMPSNVYVSGSVGVSTLTMDGDLPGTSDDGVAFDLTVGKEWWVGNSWGLGVAAGLNYFSAKDNSILDSPENWSGPGFAVRFSATLN